MNPTQLLSLTAALSLGFAAGAGFVALPQLASAAPESALLQETREIGVQEAGADEVDMLQAWIEANQIGEHHRLLTPFVGRFDAEITNYMEGESETSTGRMVNTWMYEGRYLQQKYSGDMAGMSFEGMALWGYSNPDETYKSVWVDSMSTNLSYSAGWASEDGKTFTMIGSDKDPMSGEMVPFEDVIQVVSDDEHTFTRSETRAGEKAKSMEIRYTRAQ
jgi:hypothetical protein